MQMLAMLCFEREFNHSTMLKTIGMIPFLNFIIRLKRIYLKLRVKLTRDVSYRQCIENERFSLKSVRNLIKVAKA